MVRVGVLIAAFALGGAVGFLNNAISGWAWRLGGKSAPRGPGSVSWPSLFALQFALRIALSLVSLYVAFRVSGGDTGVILANLAGLFLARYLMLWRLSRKGAEGGPV